MKTHISLISQHTPSHLTSHLTTTGSIIVYDIQRGGQGQEPRQEQGQGQLLCQGHELGQVFYVPSAHTMSGVNQPAWIVAFNPHDKVRKTYE